MVLKHTKKFVFGHLLRTGFGSGPRCPYPYPTKKVRIPTGSGSRFGSEQKDLDPTGSGSKSATLAPWAGTTFLSILIARFDWFTLWVQQTFSSSTVRNTFSTVDQLTYTDQSNWLADSTRSV
jgi:hypothetical protein